MSEGSGQAAAEARQERSDAEQAVRYFAIKAAIFILLPLAVAVGTAVWVLQ